MMMMMMTMNGIVIGVDIVADIASMGSRRGVVGPSYHYPRGKPFVV